MKKRLLIISSTLALVALLAAGCAKDETTTTTTSTEKATSGVAGNLGTDTSSTTVSSTDTTATAATATYATGTLGGDDKEFVTKAAQGGMAEVDLGKVAGTNASNADVKAFGDRMVTDHSKANDELKQLATAKGVTLPAEPSKDQKETAAKLSKLSGTKFDKAYMDDMVKDHEKDVKEFDKASKSAKDADLKAWAAKTLPTLQDHLKMARDTKAKVK